MTPATDGAEQRSQQQEVVVGLLGTQSQLHGLVDNRVEVGLSGVRGQRSTGSVIDQLHLAKKSKEIGA